MLDRIRRTLSYANVMSTIAVFAALGGGAYAATKIGAKDIKKNAVRAKHVKKGQIASKHLKKDAVTRVKIRAGAVSGPEIADNAVSEGKLAPNAVTGAKVDESTLGTVPNADRLDGLDSLSFVRGGGRLYSVRGTDALGGGASAPVVLDIGGTLTLTCNNPASVGSDFTFTNTSGGVVDVWTDGFRGITPIVSGSYQSVASNANVSVSVPGPDVDVGRGLSRFTIVTATRSTTIEAKVVFTGGACRFVALITETS